MILIYIYIEKYVYLLHLIENYCICFYSYAGRPTAASSATGSKMQHLKELKALLDQSFAV